MSVAYELFRALGRVTSDAEEEDGKFTILFDPDNDDHQLIASSLGSGDVPEEGQTVRFSFTIKPETFQVTTEGGSRRRRTRRRKGYMKRTSKKQ